MTVTLGPLMEVARIQSEINRLFDTLTDLQGGEHPGETWIPNVDILETPETLVLRAELPGVDAAALQVTVLDGNVVLRGAKARPDLPPGTTFHAVERSFGEFKRVVHLGVPVNTRLAAAELHNGLLRITFPKVPNRRGEEVAIEVQSR